MNGRLVTCWSALLASGLMVAGCHSSVAPAETAPATDAADPAVQPTADAAAPANEPTLANAEAVTPAKIKVVANFTPPFPDRLELFEPPKGTQGTVRRDEEHGESVELKGFINVDQPRVVLSIDGVISPVPQGGEKYGVQVISIQPPSVVLQRGRSRWTATLE